MSEQKSVNNTNIDTPQFRVAMAQLNFLVGDISGNTEKIIKACHQAQKEQHADLFITSELALTGYPPEDLLLRPSLEKRIAAALSSICEQVPDMTIILGYPGYQDDKLYNMAGVIHQGALIFEYAKHHLPNYQVFDEKRYFVPGQETCTVEINGCRLGLVICEDLWFSSPLQQLSEQGVDLVVSLNASPFHAGKLALRRNVLFQAAKVANAPVIYVNQCGAQDELVFDGASMVFDSAGTCIFQAPEFSESLDLIDIDLSANTLVPLQPSAIPLSEEASIYAALVTGVRDYVHKNGFPSVVLGLSGGIDSALTAAIAVDALGAENVKLVMMPFRYTSSMSLEDAEAEAKMLKAHYEVISIEPIVTSFMQQLSATFAGRPADTTEENLQARCRGVILMAISNKTGALVLTTGNKSEVAVGYSTLYGDMAGGYDVLKDVEKTLVYRLSRYRNTLTPVIPQRVIDRPPSAELAPDQKDQDSLPDYDQLDAILKLYVEQDYSADAIIAEGFEAAIVHRVIRLVDVNEYKRRQAPIGPRITQRGFGRDRRYPITSGWKAGI